MTTETPKTTPSKKRSKPSAGGATTDSGAPIGEGSFEGTERYAEGIEHYVGMQKMQKPHFQRHWRVHCVVAPRLCG